MLQTLLNFFLPHSCILCHDKTQREIDLCLNCETSLPRINWAYECCGQALTTSQSVCGACLQDAPPFARTVSVFHYHYPIDHLIGGLKFGKNLVYAEILSNQLQQKLEGYYKNHLLPEAVIPVPLHAKRLQERGFNQALEIARPIAKYFKIPLIRFACTRTKNTLAQATLPAKERSSNIKNAFVVGRTIPYKHVAVIDDVITTGNTVNELCYTLGKAGIDEIDVWCCARANTHMQANLII